MKKKQDDNDKYEIERGVLRLLKSISRYAASEQGLSKERTEKFVDELEKAWEEGLKSNKSNKEMEKVITRLFKKYGIDGSKW